MVGGKAAAEAGAVTAVAVRCSAWLGAWSFGFELLDFCGQLRDLALQLLNGVCHVRQPREQVKLLRVGLGKDNCSAIEVDGLVKAFDSELGSGHVHGFGGV